MRGNDTGSLIFRATLILLGLAAVAFGRYWAAQADPSELQVLGTLKATEFTVTSEVSARIRQVKVEEGQTVRAGQQLIRLDDAAVQLQYRMAGPAELQQLKLELPKYILLAPRPGIVLHRAAEPGDLAMPGVPLLAMADLNQLETTVPVAERDLSGIAVGQRVSVEAESANGVSFPAHVLSIADAPAFQNRNLFTTSDRIDQSFDVKVRLDNGDSRLKPGISVIVRFEKQPSSSRP